METLDFKNILVRKPWFHINPEFSEKSTNIRDKQFMYSPEDYATWDIRTQDDMLREYYPQGHKIMNATLYPDVLKKDPESGKYFVQPITRCTVAMQQIIATKHIIHICGNDIQFELSEYKTSHKSDDELNKQLSMFKRGWLDKNMEIRFYEAIRSLKVTAEACVVGYIENGKFGCKTLSFMNGDTLYPHYNSITGELEMFARRYFDYDEDGKATTEWVEIWDDTFFYRAKRDAQTKHSIIGKMNKLFGLTGFKLVGDYVRHGFNCVPVAYYRDDDGACWENAQNTIEHYEEAISYFFENNKAFAFPILVMSGDGIDVNGDDMTGAVKSITIDSTGGDAHFLEGNDVSSSYNALLNLMYKTIYEQAFAVKPPELKSGDLPGVALKLLYSPAIEKAMDDAQKLQPFLDKLVAMVKFGYGLEQNCQASLMSLGINAWIEPYVHQNDTELTTNLTTAVQNSILSKQTASERLSKYAKNDEYDRIIREMKEKNDETIRIANVENTHSTDEEIRKQKELDGSDINTGGGNGSERERTTDKWGNHANENNWEDWNNTH